jgi:hypothetical protein
MEAALIDEGFSSPAKGWKSPKPDLRVTFTKPMPFLPQPGPTIKVKGLITGYSNHPFQFRMDEGEAPELVCAWVKQVGASALSFDESLYVLRAPEWPDCMRETASQVWNAIDLRQRQSGGLKFSVHVISASERVITATMNTQQDEEVDLEIRLAKPMQHPPAPGALIDVQGYLSYHMRKQPDRPFTLVMVNSKMKDDQRSHSPWQARKGCSTLLNSLGGMKRSSQCRR